MKLFSNNGRRDSSDANDSGRAAAQGGFGKDFSASGDLPPITTEDISHVSPIMTLPEVLAISEPAMALRDTMSMQSAVNEQPPKYTQQRMYTQQPQGYPQPPGQAPAIPAVPEVPAPSAPPAQPTPNVMQYPDQTDWTEEQKRMLAMARGEGAGGANKPPKLENPQAFDHLKPPKKSPLKVILVTLIIIVLAGAVGGGGWYFWWTTYATFEYELIPVVVLEGQPVSPNEFLPDSEISRGVTASFQDPAFTPMEGPMTVPLTLRLGLRSLDTAAALFVLTPVTEIIHEFGTQAQLLTPNDLITNIQIVRNVAFSAEFSEPNLPLDEYEVGEYTIGMTLNGAPFSVALYVVDTTPPTAMPQTVTVRIGEEVTPDEFLEDIFDLSGIESVVFIGDFEGEESVVAYREQIVQIQVTDIYGNFEIFHSSLEVLRNEQPPTLNEVPNVIESMVGRELSYPAEVTAFDDFGRELEIIIDDSELDTDEVGEYTITYITQDFSGQETRMDVTVFIIGIDPLDVDAWVDAALGRILTDGMTQEEKVQAIFNEVRRAGTAVTTALSNTEWTGSVYTAAHWIINNTRGEFYHFYALSELMLNAAGIVNIRVERSEVSPSELPHLWSLILFDGDGWYFYDSFRATDRREINAMQHKFTQAQADEIAEHMESQRWFGKPGYYDFVSILYPDVKAE